MKYFMAGLLLYVAVTFWQIAWEAGAEVAKQHGFAAGVLVRIAPAGIGAAIAAWALWLMRGVKR